MYLLYTKDSDGHWTFWEEDFGWADLGSATPYLCAGPVAEGDWLYVGPRLKLLSFATLMLDMMEVMKQHQDTNLASPAGRLALAGWLAQGLRSQPASEASLASDEIYDYGYVVYV
jgi:hypothetical protein